MWDQELRYVGGFGFRKGKEVDFFQSFQQDCIFVDIQFLDLIYFGFLVFGIVEYVICVILSR